MRTFVVERFQPGDGTAYTMHFTKHVYGGWIVMVNNKSTWLLFDKDEIELKFLHGEDDLGYTKKAIIQYWEKVRYVNGWA